MRTAAVLPVKRFSAAKRRLGAGVEEQLRDALVRTMVADVIEALGDTPAIELTIVVTGQPDAAEAGARPGVMVVEDRLDEGQSAAASLGVERALREGFERVLCVPGDCPALSPSELQKLLGSHRTGGPEVVIIPDRHGSGTNGLLLAPPDAIAPSFGPGSFERHRALVLASGAGLRVQRPPSLLLDIDTDADLAELRRRLAGSSGGAPRTRALLAAAPAGPASTADSPPVCAGEHR